MGSETLAILQDFELFMDSTVSRRVDSYPTSPPILPRKILLPPASGSIIALSVWTLGLSAEPKLSDRRLLHLDPFF